MAKVIFCKESVANALKAELSAQIHNEDITGNTFASGAFGMKVIQKDDEFFKGMKTKEGKPADMIEVDESKFKIQMPQFKFDEIGKRYKLTVFSTMEANSLILDGKYKFKRMPSHWFPESYTEDGKIANMFMLYEGKENNYYALKCIESETSIDELMVDIEKLIEIEGDKA